MDWSKLDASLAGALADEQAHRKYSVFVHLTVDVGPDVLAELGVEASGNGRVRTATVSADDVDRLSEQEWVSQLRMSTSLNLATEG